MRRFIAAFVATVAGLVLLLSFKIAPTKSAAQPLASGGVSGSSAPGSSAPQASPPASSASSAPNSPSTSATPSASATPRTTSTPKAAKSTTKTVTGSTVTVGERGRVFGTVQVRLTLTGGKITAITELQYPQNDPRSSQISQFAIPTLRAETLSAQSAQIDTVSGATYTSAGYAQSVQAALNSAKS